MTKTPRTDAEATQSCDSGLRLAYVVHVDFARELEREIARLTAERDEARRMACHSMTQYNAMMFDNPKYGNPEEVAKAQGWDCFNSKENTNET